MLLYPGVMISRTRSRGGLMPTWGDSQRYSIDYSNTAWGSDVDFSVIQAQNVWIRTLYDKHRFVVRGNLGWIETGDFDAFRRICASSPGATAAFVAISTNRSRLRTKTAS
jgi:translocation and assembly module TamA